MKVLIVTSEWPRFDGDISGIHVIQQKHCLEQIGVQVDVFPFRGQKRPLNYWHAGRELQRLDLARYNLIHAHHGQSGLVALAQRHLPVVVTFHGSDLQGIRDFSGKLTWQGHILRQASRWVAARANAVILVSETLASRLPAGVKYQVIPAGINTDLFKPIPQAAARQQLGLPEKGHLVLFVGNPSRTEKRHWLAENTIQALPLDTPAQLVTVHGIPHETMPIYMNACDVLLVTSSTEGSPNAVKEALACNLPIVSTDVGDIRDRIQGIHGCHVCSDDQAESLARALSSVLKQRVRINGRESVLNMDEMNLAIQVLQLYKQVAGF